MLIFTFVSQVDMCEYLPVCCYARWHRFTFSHEAKLSNAAVVIIPTLGFESDARLAHSSGAASSLV